ncbi:hypothetical protein K8W59_02890 [Nocardioides rotundus]|uniref:glycoside hydrolase family 26 protein n=1 Tax=Nocardioides rotundus TaxID=1774216 RepID=UPI0021D7E285|nr:glycosyl hydrolase [Nocardioides rotundus]UAL30489.1 hypothetical protein K8W59_02890 [Nocardioides rotundus]
MRRFSDRTSSACVGWTTTLAAVALLSACTSKADPGRSTGTGSGPSPTDVSVSPNPAADRRECDYGSADVRTGVFRETRREEVTTYQDWLGCRVDYVVDFPARRTWDQLAQIDYLLQEWRGMDRRLVLSLGLLPEDEPADFATGATGAYDDRFTAVGEALVAAGREDTIIRLGWEFNLLESRWYTPDADAFIAYWRRVVDTLRAVPGQRFEFTWNLGRSGVDAVPYYPGDEYVDQIGVDVYDATGADGTYPYPDDCDEECRRERQDTAWEEEILGGERGLEFWADFARDRGKPLALPEWGLWDRPDAASGDANSSFIRRMYDFMSDPENNVAYQAYFEFDGSDGTHRLMTTFPEQGEIYRDLLR